MARSSASARASSTWRSSESEVADGDRDRDGSLTGVPVLARLAASAWWHAAERGAGLTLALGSRFVRTAFGGSPAPANREPRERAATPDRDSDTSRMVLRERGEELLSRSADVAHDEELHPAYARILDLNRLGLIWFSRETLRDINRYQVLEAQPEAIEAMGEAGRTARTVRRSIHLTPFGTDFCEVCLPLDAPKEETGPAPADRSGADG